MGKCTYSCKEAVVVNVRTTATGQLMSQPNWTTMNLHTSKICNYVFDNDLSIQRLCEHV